MSQKILITSALPYANGPLHFGHIAGAYLPADCYARFERLMGNDVLFLCGSDEYGVAITLSAQLANRTPKEQAERFHEINKGLFNKLNFSFNHYSRTTWKGHAETVQKFFLDLCDNGYIEKRTEDHLFSPSEDLFLADRYVVGVCPHCGYDNARGDECSKCGASYEAIDLINPKSKLTGAELECRPSKHWYLRFDKFQSRLVQWIEEKQWKPNVMNFTMNYLKDLKPRSITRDSTWGVPLPLTSAEGKVLYVWFDAPIGYVSAAKEWSEIIGEKDKWKEYWLDNHTKLVQFIGKDNIPFHTIFFPAMIMGQSCYYKMPDDVPANEFLLLEGKQFSKSDGWYIDLEEFFKSYSVDQIRYYLAANAPETSDAEFLWKDFQNRCNSELLGKFGNFINRTLVFAKNNCSATVPARKTLDAIDKEFLTAMQDHVDQIKEAYSKYHLRKACQIIMSLSHKGNLYFDTKKPWLLVKDSNKKDEMETVIALCIECIKDLAVMASPIIPTSAQKIWEMIGYNTSIEKQILDEVVLRIVEKGTILPTPKVLFRKIENSEIDIEIDKLEQGGVKMQKDTKPSAIEDIKSSITYKDFMKTEMRVGKIIGAEKVKKSDKLLKLKVDIGNDDIRQIVSGIAKFYDVDDLIDKCVVVVSNLKPAKLMGIESQGMILAAGDDDNLEVLFVSNQKPGNIVC
jgi:methionyl-tRNA synthetase